MTKLENFLKNIWYTEKNHDLNPVHLFLYIPSLIYSAVIRLRNLSYDHGLLKQKRLRCPVISVGNLTVGGTGKTPMVIELAGLFMGWGLKPAVLSRGYGGKSTKEVDVISDGRSILSGPDEGGDEPFLVARRLPAVPVLTGIRRAVTGEHALEHFGIDVVVLDDGFQHRSLRRDLDIVLLDGGHPLGNGHLIPRGPLREPFSSLKRADIIVLTRAGKSGKTPFESRLAEELPSIPVFKACHRPGRLTEGDGTSRPLSDLTGRKIYAFAGVARPDSFRESIESLQGVIVGFRAFPDHHLYTAEDIAEIEKEAGSLAADLILTTEKDGVKLAPCGKFANRIWILGIELDIIEEKERFVTLIRKKLGIR
jgi:tetraacyldisaccharide 4'-kinase